LLDVDGDGTGEVTLAGATLAVIGSTVGLGVIPLHAQMATASRPAKVARVR
jgi:hypothetical protein